MQEIYDADKEGMKGWAMVAHSFNPSTQGGRGTWVSVSSRLAWSTE